jgi:hypothetical protein
VCATILGRYGVFDELVNRSFGEPAALLGSGYGKIASGPVTLLRAMELTLAAEDVSTVVLTRGRHEQWAPERGELRVLDLGDSWIVARSFREPAA